ncbi:MAG: hypothetical protein RL189_313 [Pseudomonadota bacterium]|jgi:hypothetical protein
MRALYASLFVLRQSIKHRKKVFFFSWLFVFSLLVVWIHRIPKSYKTSALFNFHSDFSKVPASSEFFNEIYDPNEIRAEKEAILLGVLSDEFLFHIAERYIGKDAAEKEWVVQGLRRDIRFVPLSRTTYQLIVVQRSGESAQNIALEVIERLENTLRQERLARMQSVYNSIAQQLNDLTVEGRDKNLSPNLNAVQIRLQNEIAHLEQAYTNDHPRLLRLRQKLQSLREAKDVAERSGIERGHIENWVSLRGILVTRKALLQVALRMEENADVTHIKIIKEPDLPLWPVEPKKNLLLASALLTSVIFAAATSALIAIASEVDNIFPQLREGWQKYLASISAQTDKPSTGEGKEDV